MKISYAIRKGMKGTKGCTGELVKGDNMACALGCVGLAIGMKRSELQSSTRTYEKLKTAFPQLTSHVNHPVSGEKYNLMDAIYGLNDSAKWPRRKISDWLQSIGL